MKLVNSFKKGIYPEIQFLDQESLIWINDQKNEYFNKINSSELYLPEISIPQPPDKRWFLNQKLYNSIHGSKHSLRVFIHIKVLLFNKLVSNREKHSLLLAGLFHDIRRINDRKDSKHSERATKWVNDNFSKILNLYPEYKNSSKSLVLFIIKHHNLRSEDFDSKILGSNKYRLLSIFKLADALDRFRLPKKSWWIDFEKLSIKPTNKQVLFAFELVIISEVNYINGMSIQNSIGKAFLYLRNLEIKNQIISFIQPSLEHYGLNLALNNVIKEYEIYEKHELRKRTPLSNLDDVKIQIGNGSNVLNEFINIDIVEPADIIFDVREGVPVCNGVAKQVFAEHFLEHLDYPRSAFYFIKECYRILKNGGECIIGIPDTELVIKNYVNRDKYFLEDLKYNEYSKRINFELDTYIDLVNYHLRDQQFDMKYSPHYWGYDFEKLSTMLKKIGFISVEKWSPDRDMCNPKRIKNSLYVIAKK